jgi:putative nucleotidyltransferase with HDIG domain
MMGWTVNIFKSKLGWRFFMMFVSCALIPILVLALTSYVRVSRQLRNQALDRLQQAAKAHGLSITEHLILADDQLKLVQTTLAASTDPSFDSVSITIAERYQAVFSGLAVIHGEELIDTWGEYLSKTWRRHILSQGAENPTDTRLMVIMDSIPWPRVLLVRKLAGSTDHPDYLVGIVDHSFLWGVESGTILPPVTESCVWDAQDRLLFTSLGAVDALNRLPAEKRAGRTRSGPSELTIRHQRYIAAYWAPFLKARFQTPYWTVSVMEPEAHVIEPLRYFRVIFPLTVLLTFVVVIWLSVRAIRTSLIPIDALMEGARQVANRRFDHHVFVDSGDEFEALANAFNHMTGQLDIQFNELTARAEFDRNILSVQSLDRIVCASLNHSRQFLPYQIAAISIMATDGQLDGRSFIQEKTGNSTSPGMHAFQLTTQDYEFFKQHRTWKRIDADDKAPTYLHAMLRSDVGSFWLLPIWINTRLFALVSLGLKADYDLTRQDMDSFQKFADHLAVAFTNFNLIGELKELNMGTLYALARTVDAKSSWTAGHSARVTHVAGEIAKAMGMNQKDQDNITRAGLLHDIGKISTPLSILDKNGKLSEEEYDQIKRHPSIGARILSPIRAYSDLIPIVEQHHECYDGKGYPHGLSNEQIHPLARILAVADTFDAMVSDRPYRKGLSLDRALEIITAEAGHQFDPHVVTAFIRMMEGSKAAGLFSSNTTMSSASPEEFYALTFTADKKPMATQENR